MDRKLLQRWVIKQVQQPVKFIYNIMSAGEIMDELKNLLAKLNIDKEYVHFRSNSNDLEIIKKYMKKKD